MVAGVVEEERRARAAVVDARNRQRPAERPAVPLLHVVRLFADAAVERIRRRVEHRSAEVVVAVALQAAAAAHAPERTTGATGTATEASGTAAATTRAREAALTTTAAGFPFAATAATAEALGPLAGKLAASAAPAEQEHLVRLSLTAGGRHRLCRRIGREARRKLQLGSQRLGPLVAARRGIRVRVRDDIELLEAASPSARAGLCRRASALTRRLDRGLNRRLNGRAGGRGRGWLGRRRAGRRSARRRRTGRERQREIDTGRALRLGERRTSRSGRERGQRRTHRINSRARQPQRERAVLLGGRRSHFRVVAVEGHDRDAGQRQAVRLRHAGYRTRPPRLGRLRVVDPGPRARQRDAGGYLAEQSGAHEAMSTVF